MRVTHKFAFLDGLRGLAALYVMIGHARSLLWEGFATGFLQHQQDYNLLNKGLVYFFTLFRFGLEAVFFFFVLSGFLIHLKYARLFQADPRAKFGFSDYLIRRIRRIYPPFLFALLLTYGLDTLGASLGFWTPTFISGINRIATITTFLDLKTLFGNLAFLYYSYTPIFGSNGPSWSLKYEWWFYIIYPLVLLVARKKVIVATVIIVFLFTLSFYPGLWPEELSRDVFSLIVCWWLGVLLAEVYVGRISISLKYISWLIGILPLMPLIKDLPAPVYYSFFSLGVAGIIALCLYLQERKFSLRILERFALIGSFSFTLYIIHYPIFVFIRGWWQLNHNGALPMNFGLALAGILFVGVLAYLVHFLTELPFLRSGRNLAGVRLNSQVI